MNEEGKAVYNQRHKDNPLLPIDDIRSAVQDVEVGRFVPDREKDELTRALKNYEHKGQSRGTKHYWKNHLRFHVNKASSPGLAQPATSGSTSPGP